MPVCETARLVFSPAVAALLVYVCIALVALASLSLLSLLSFVLPVRLFVPARSFGLRPPVPSRRVLSCLVVGVVRRRRETTSGTLSPGRRSPRRSRSTSSSASSCCISPAPLQCMALSGSSSKSRLSSPTSCMHPRSLAPVVPLVPAPNNNTFFTPSPYTSPSQVRLVRPRHPLVRHLGSCLAGVASLP